jgi:hypothetical protein
MRTQGRPADEHHDQLAQPDGRHGAAVRYSGDVSGARICDRRGFMGYGAIMDDTYRQIGI